jgi:hypothetical protein
MNPIGNSVISNQDQQNETTNSGLSSLWTIAKGKNGDKYLTYQNDNIMINDSNTNDDTNQNYKTPLDDNNNSNNNNDHDYDDDSKGLYDSSKIRVYPIRWFILVVICLANISNAINWINYSAIADFTGKFYNVDYNKVNYLSLVYMIIATPAGLLSFWLIDNIGLRASINAGAWINFIGASLRMLSSLEKGESGEPLIGLSSKYWILLTGQCLCACAQPFIVFLSTKFANDWFAEDQRAIANTIALASNIFGTLIGAVISPQIITISTGSTHMSEMSLLNVVTCIFAFLPALLALTIRRSVPILPPSYSTLINIQKRNIKINSTSNNNDNDNNRYTIDEDSEERVISSGSTSVSVSISSTNPMIIEGSNNKNMEAFKAYVNEIFKLLKCKQFIILFFCFGLSLGIFNTMATLVQQILCIRGLIINMNTFLINKFL